MIVLRDLDVLDLEVLGRVTMGDVAAPLQRFGMHHLLVAESLMPQGPAHIRGVISHTEVEPQLGSPLPTIMVAQTFAEIALALA
jgi:hypothetical protein